MADKEKKLIRLKVTCELENETFDTIQEESLLLVFRDIQDAVRVWQEISNTLAKHRIENKRQTNSAVV